LTACLGSIPGYSIERAVALTISSPLHDLNEDLPLIDADEDPPASDPPSGLDSPSPDSESNKSSSSDTNSDDEELHITLDKVKATVESHFSPADFRMFQNPLEHQFSPSDNPDLQMSIDFYISTLDHTQSQRAYTKTQSIVQKSFPDSNVLSYDQVKRRISKLSGDLRKYE
jgi:hypothetical protein